MLHDDPPLNARNRDLAFHSDSTRNKDFGVGNVQMSIMLVAITSTYVNSLYHLFMPEQVRDRQTSSSQS